MSYFLGSFSCFFKKMSIYKDFFQTLQFLLLRAIFLLFHIFSLPSFYFYFQNLKGKNRVVMQFLFACLRQIDSNTDGLVDFHEFVAATLHVHQLEEHNSEKWQQVSQAAFEKFDVDRDGYITPEELKMVLLLVFSLVSCLIY